MSSNRGGVSASRAVRVAVAWFAVLAVWALASPSGSARDEAFHMASIYCGRGVHPELCPESTFNEEAGLRFSVVPIKVPVCSVTVEEPFICPSSLGETNSYISNDGLYPDFYYRAMSYLAIPFKHETTTLLIRLTNAALSALAVGVTLLLMSRSALNAYLVATISTAVPMVVFLLSSINPRAWGLIGIGMVWPIVGGLVDELTKSRRNHRRLSAQAGALLVSFVVAIFSRWDSAVMWVFIAVWSVVLQTDIFKLPRRARQIVSLFVVVALSLPFWPSNIRVSLGLSGAGVEYRIRSDELTALIHWILHAVPKASEVLGLGDVGYTPLKFPRLVPLLGTIIVGGLVWRALTSRRIDIWLCAISVVIFTGLILFAHSRMTDDFDPFDISAQYVVMYFPAIVGLLTSAGTQRNSRPLPSSIIGKIMWPLALVHALAIFTVVERFVDVQLFGVRWVPSGVAQWWWTWLPFGPNTWVGLGVIAFVVVMLEMRDLLRDQMAPLPSGEQ